MEVDYRKANSQQLNPHSADVIHIMKQSTFEALLRVYVRLEEIVEELNNLSDNAVDLGDYDDASLLQARANILYEQMENLDFVISELEG
jgi:hypothetical protein